VLVAIVPTKRKIRSVPPLLAFAQGFLIWVLVVFPPLLHAQEIRIRVLNARTGKPITDECLNVWVGPLSGTGLLAPTNNEGAVVLHLGDNQVTANAVSSPACHGVAVLGPKPLPKDADTIAIASDYYVACQEYGKVVPGEPATPNLVREIMPSYSTKKILESGVSAPNTCGKFRAEAKPGELIFFVRARKFLERMRQ
jgi:hypothetical protein